VTAAPGEVTDDAGQKVSLIVMATGRYIEFLDSLLASARLHVRGLDEVFVLSDRRPNTKDGVRWLPWGHLAWPYPTLLRYRAISSYREVLAEAEVLLYVDVDMRFVGDVDLTLADGLIAVQHPGFSKASSEDFPYERRSESCVSVAIGLGTTYFAGGVQGGVASEYLAACVEMATWVQSDLDRELIPVWHDESVWNRRCVARPPKLVLSPSYCTPETQKRHDTRIVALDKDHDKFREVSMRDRALKAGRFRIRQAHSKLRRVAKASLQRRSK
jgi:histo-blood group ABO system transferase